MMPNAAVDVVTTMPRVFSPSRIAAKANAQQEIRFVLERRHQEREAAARRVRCNFRRRGQWTRSYYTTEYDLDAARIATSSARRFLIATRARRAIAKRRRLFAVDTIACFVARQARRRRDDSVANAAALDSLAMMERRQAGKVITASAREFLERRALRRLIATSQIQEFVRARLAVRRARAEAQGRLEAARLISRSCHDHYFRRRTEQARRDALAVIRRVVARRLKLARAVAGRCASAARVIQRMTRGRHARRAYVVRREASRLAQLENVERSAAGVLLRWAHLILARKRTRAVAVFRKQRAQRRAGACAIVTLVYYIRLRERAERRREAKRVFAEQTRAAALLTGFARGIIAKGRCRRIVQRRATLLAAKFIQRVWRGALGRARFNRIKAESYRCRRCDALEYGGRYCKRCGFARYVQTPVKIDYGNSPYAPSRVRPNFVKKMRSRIAATAAARRRASTSSFLPLIETAIDGNEGDCNNAGSGNFGATTRSQGRYGTHAWHNGAHVHS